MKQKIFTFILMAILFTGCNEDEIVPVATLSVEGLKVNASYTTADIIWNVQSAATIEEVVLEYSTDSTFQTYKEIRMQQTDKTSNQYKIVLNSLINGTNYFIRCRVINKINSNISENGAFSTLPYSLAKVVTDTITDIDVSSAVLRATLMNSGSDVKPSIGFYIATHPNVTEEDSCIMVSVENVTDSLPFSYVLSNLDDNVMYFVRAFAQNIKGIAWGEELSFITTEMLLPTVGATTLKYVSYTNAICSSEIISDGRGSILERGFCYATTDNPTIENNKKINEGEDKVYNSYLSDLTASTTYYVRAYAINPKGVAYGEQLEFTTKDYSLPIVTTSNVTNIKYTTATCGGEVTDDGGQSVVERGVCYSTSPNPTILNYKVECGSGKGEFSYNMTGLEEGVTYYVRAYATNAIGTIYGEDVMFATSFHMPNVIYYTASQKLNETSDNSTPGLHVYRFGVPILSHDFEDGEGVITFDGVLTGIGNYAFFGCSSLTSIILPNSVTNIGENAFFGCSSIPSINIPTGVINIGDFAFKGCTSLTFINIPDGVTKIGESAFSECSNLSYIFIPESVTSIGREAFNECSSLETINIPYGVTIIDYRLFIGCSSLSSISLHDGITEIGSQAFSGCSSLVSFEMPINATTLGDRAFSRCTSLTSVKLSDMMYSIGYGTFSNCM